MTPLHAAALSGNSELVRSLLEAGAQWSAWKSMSHYHYQTRSEDQGLCELDHLENKPVG